jgi:hypothetical protein
MNINYEVEFKKALLAMFPDAKLREEALAELNKYGAEDFHREAARVRLSILKLVHNQPEKLSYYVGVACSDFRDILCWAEYPETSKRWGLQEKNPERYKKLQQKEEQEYLSWLESLQP